MCYTSPPRLYASRASCFQGYISGVVLSGVHLGHRAFRGTSRASCFQGYIPGVVLSGVHLGRRAFRGTYRASCFQGYISGVVLSEVHLRPHGRVVSVLSFSKFTPVLPFLRTIELPCVIATYNCTQRYTNNYVQLLSTSCVFDCPNLRYTKALM